jgi:outer membrane protein TolC
MRNYILFSICLLVLSYSVGAQEAMTLEKAISIGLEENFNIKIIDEQIRVAEASNTWARAGRGVVVDLNGTFSLGFINDNNPASFINKPFLNGSLGGSLDASWLVLSGGRVAVAKDQLDLAVHQQEILKSVEAQTLIRDVIQAYYTVLFQQERLSVLEETLELSKSRLAYEEVKKEFGTSNSFNLVQFEDAVLSDSTNYISQAQLVETSEKNLNTLLTVPFDVDYDFPERLQVNIEELDEVALEKLLLEDSPTLRTLYLASDLQILNQRLQESLRKPTLALNASIGLAENYFQFLEADVTRGITTDGLFSNRLNVGVGANFNWNLIDGGVSKANIENAKMQEGIAELDILQATLQLKNQLSTLVLQYNNEKELLSLASDRLLITKQNLEMAEERFKLAQINSIDYRSVQTQYINNAFALVNSMFNLAITKSEIDWLVGVYVESDNLK